MATFVMDGRLEGLGVDVDLWSGTRGTSAPSEGARLASPRFGENVLAAMLSLEWIELLADVRDRAEA